MKLMNNIDKEEKKLIRKMFWRSGAMYASVNPVTMGGAGFCYAMIPSSTISIRTMKRKDVKL